MKKIVSLFLLMILGFSGVYGVTALTGTVNTATLNLRKEPNSSSTILEQLDENTELEVVEEEGDWYKVKYESDEGTVTGYVSKEYIKTDGSEIEHITEPEETEEIEEPVEQPEETTDEPEPEPVQEEPVDNTEVIENEYFEEGNEAKLSKDTDLRTVPSFSSRVTAVISNDTTVQVLDRLNNWAKITDGTNTGWIINI